MFMMFWRLLFQNLIILIALSVPCQARSHTPWRLKSSQDDLKMESRCPSWVNVAIFVATACGEISYLSPRSSKIAELVAEIAQNSAQERPTRPSKTRKYSKTVVLSIDF